MVTASYATSLLINMLGDWKPTLPLLMKRHSLLSGKRQRRRRDLHRFKDRCSVTQINRMSESANHAASLPKPIIGTGSIKQHRCHFTHSCWIQKELRLSRRPPSTSQRSKVDANLLIGRLHADGRVEPAPRYSNLPLSYRLAVSREENLQ